jgi:hypothetical protein
MSREFAKKRYSEKRSAQQGWRRTIFVFIFLLLLSGIGFGIYHYKNQFSLLANWFSERKNHLQQGMTKVKQLTVNKKAEPEPIHFEFYTTLPNMQVKPSVPPVEDSKRIAKATPLPTPQVKQPLFDPAEIEEDVSSQLKSRESRE